MRAFTIAWLGQLLSLTGSGLTTFVLGLWVYIDTKSVTKFALISFFGTLPSLVLLPFAGALVDRWNRRSAMIVSDLGAALAVLFIAVLLWAGRLEIWHIYIAVAFSSAFGALRWPAFSAAIPLLVPPRHLGRANGMVQAAEAAGAIVPPLLGGFLLVTVPLYFIILIDFSTFLFSLSLLFLVRFPKPTAGREEASGKGSLLREAAYGWKYISTRPGLLSLLIFFSFLNLILFGIGQRLLTPLLLSFSSPKGVGIALTLGSAGVLIGSAIMTVWGGPKRRVKTILELSLLQGVFAVVIGLQPNLMLVTAALFLLTLPAPIIAASNQSIWQSKVALHVQGRVFAVRRMLGWSSFPLAYLLVGPLADRTFEPLMAPGGSLTGSFGWLVGVGTGRGIALLFVLIGLLTVLAAIVGYMFPRLRLLEQELPNAVSAHTSPPRCSGS